MIMTFDYVDMTNAIFNAIDQDYPNELKTLYLLYQEPFPPKLSHDLPVRVREFWVTGFVGSGWWLKKLEMFLNACSEPYMLTWDEDDRYEHMYTRKALQPILEGRARITWNYNNVMVKYGYMRHEKYRSAIGTLCGEVVLLKQVAVPLFKKYPDGRLKIVESKRKRGSHGMPYYKRGRKRKKKVVRYAGGAMDNYFRRDLAKKHAADIAEHDGLRFYTFSSTANTKGGRLENENIDRMNYDEGE